MSCLIFIFQIVCERNAAFALGCAVARAYPSFTRKKGSNKAGRTVTVEYLFVGDDKTPLTQDEANCITYAAESVRLAARIVDTPCNEMNTDCFLEVRSFKDLLRVVITLQLIPLCIPVICLRSKFTAPTVGILPVFSTDVWLFSFGNNSL